MKMNILYDCTYTNIQKGTKTIISMDKISELV